MPGITTIEDTTSAPAVRGFLHAPDGPAATGLVLAHGAGSNAQAPLLVAVADTFSAAGIMALRIDLPFRQGRPHGSPHPAHAAQDREGIKRAVLLLRDRVSGRVYMGGHSYGGRQASMLLASEPGLAAGLLLFSYPLHAPGKSDLRTAHFPQIKAPAVFVHGTRDPFGTIEEMWSALRLLAGPHELTVIEGTGHDLGGKGPKATHVADTALEVFRKLMSPPA